MYLKFKTRSSGGQGVQNSLTIVIRWPPIRYTSMEYGATSKATRLNLVLALVQRLSFKFTVFSHNTNISFRFPVPPFKWGQPPQCAPSLPPANPSPSSASTSPISTSTATEYWPWIRWGWSRTRCPHPMSPCGTPCQCPSSSHTIINTNSSNHLTINSNKCNFKFRDPTQFEDFGLEVCVRNDLKVSFPLWFICILQSQAKVFQMLQKMERSRRATTASQGSAWQD